MKLQAKRFLVSSLLLFLILSGLPAFSTAVSSARVSEYAPNEILVAFKPSANDNEIASLHRSNDATLRGKIPQIRTHRVKLPPNRSLMDVIERYKNSPLVEFAEPNYVRYVHLVPNDTFFSSQWSLEKINVQQAWDITTGEENATIAVVDTGVDYTHEDLADKIIKGYDYHNNDSDPMDDNGHGTRVAGIAAAATDNSKGIAGVSWKSKILAIKAIGSAGYGYDYNVAYGIIYAADKGAKVINLSLGAESVGWVLGMAVSYAQSKGSLIVANVGNDGANKALYPAAYNGVIGVGATDLTDTVAFWSNYGAWVDVVAPGVNIRSTDLGNTYSLGDGTSFAAPFVAGLAALISSKYPKDKSYDIEARLQSTALDLGIASRDDYYGFGRIDAYNALSASGIRYEQTNGGVSWTGTWGTASNPSHSGGNAKYSNTAGDFAEFTFSGTSVSWIANTRPDRGIAKVYIDGIYDQDVDLYDPVGAFQQAVYTKTGLTDASHTLKIEVTSQKNPASSNYYIVVDAFGVTKPSDMIPPAIPGGLVAVGKSASIDISWTANIDSDLAGYKVYYGTTSGIYETVGDIGNATSYRIEGLTNGTMYYLAVSAYDTSRNESTKSTEVSAMPIEDGNPVAPAGLSAISTYSALKLSWNANSDSDLAGYKIYYGTASGIYGTPIDVGNVTSYKLTGLTGGTTYYLAISAIDLAGNESAKSSEIEAVPMNTRYEETSSQILYSGIWYSAADSNASGGTFKWTYSLGHWPSAKSTFVGTGVSWISYKSPDSGIARVYLDGVQQPDVDLYNNIPLYQEVGFNKTGLAPDWHTIEVIEIGSRNPVSSDYRVSLDALDILETADATPPVAPTGLAVEATSSNSVSLSWNANEEIDLAGYNIYRSMTSGGPYTKVNTLVIAGTSYYDTGLISGDTYYYTITAIDTSSNESAKSTEVSATPISLPRYEETDPAVTYTGTWGTASNPSHSGGNAKYSNTAGDFAEFTFSGTSVSWIANTRPDRGIAKVYIDGIYDQDVDLYDPVGAFQQAVYTKTGLTDASHTLKIEVTSQKNPASSNYYIVVDAFDVGVSPSDTTPPTDPTNLTAIAVSSSQIDLTWTASTDDTWVAGYKIERSLDNVTFAQIGTSSATTYSDTGLSASTTYYYRVRAYDAAGNNSNYSNTSSAITQTAPTDHYEETDPAVTYTGTWGTASNPSHSGGNAKYSNTAGDFAEFTFSGTSVSWIANTRPDRGIAKVYIDGIYDQDVDLYDPVGAFQQAVYTKTGLTDASHTLKIEVTSQKNPASSNYYIVVDAFDVGSATIRYEETDPAVAYVGTWNIASNVSHSGGTAKYTVRHGYSAEFTFSGTYVSWIANTRPDRGIAKVYIDGIYDQDVDLYDPVGAFQQAVYTKTGLTDASHTLKIEVTSQKNPSSSNYYIVVDAFDVGS